jgi:hypothetical protein
VSPVLPLAPCDDFLYLAREDFLVGNVLWRVTPAASKRWFPRLVSASEQNIAVKRGSMTQWIESSQGEFRQKTMRTPLRH